MSQQQPQCTSGAALLGEVCVLPQWDRHCRTSSLPLLVTVCWQQAGQSKHWLHKPSTRQGVWQGSPWNTIVWVSRLTCSESLFCVSTHILCDHSLWWDFPMCERVYFFPAIEEVNSPWWIIHAGCICRKHSPVQDLRRNACMHAQTRPRFILSS